MKKDQNNFSRLEWFVLCSCNLITILDRGKTNSTQADVQFPLLLYYFFIRFAISYIYIYLLVLQLILWLINHLALCFLGDFLNQGIKTALSCSVFCTKAKRVILHCG